MPSDNSLTFNVRNMHCGSCVGRVEKALRDVPGVEEATVNLAGESVRVEGGTALDANAVEAALREAG